MSDRESLSPSPRRSLSPGEKSPSPRKSRSPSPVRSHSRGSRNSLHKSKNMRSLSRSPSRHRYRGAKRSYSRSPKRKRYSRSRSRSYGRRYASRSRSRSPYYRKRRPYRSRSRSLSYSPGPPRHRSGYSDRRRGFYRSHSRSPMSERRRHMGNRDNPQTSRCIGVFGLSLYTTERELKDIFLRFGEIENIQVVMDHQTGRSRGFAFIYYRTVEDAVEAKDRATGLEVDGRRIRVDYSITQRAHTPTPGIYLGKPTPANPRHARRSYSPEPYYGGGGRSRYSRSRSRSYSYSPRRYSGRY